MGKMKMKMKMKMKTLIIFTLTLVLANIVLANIVYADNFKFDGYIDENIEETIEINQPINPNYNKTTIGGYQTGYKCGELVLSNTYYYPLLYIKSNGGYNNIIEAFNIDPPMGAKCAYLTVTTRIDAVDELTKITSTGLVFLTPDTKEQLYYIKASGRSGMSSFVNENFVSVSVPFDKNGNVYFKQLNLYPPSTPPTVLTITTVLVSGWYF
jgi:hypothetical protein